MFENYKDCPERAVFERVGGRLLIDCFEMEVFKRGVEGTIFKRGLMCDKL